MSKSGRSIAERKFATLKKKGKDSLSEREAEELRIKEKTANLRALRLAKEEVDRKAAKRLATQKAANKRRARPKKAGLATD